MLCSVADALFVVYDQSAYSGLLDWTLSGLDQERGSCPVLRGGHQAGAAS